MRKYDTATKASGPDGQVYWFQGTTGMSMNLHISDSKNNERESLYGRAVHIPREDAFYDRGSRFQLKYFLRSSIRNLRTANLVLKDVIYVYLGHQIVHRDKTLFC